MKSSTQSGVFFNFDINLNFNEKIMSQQELEELFKVTFLLGGFGKRSRRGFGSVRIISIDNKPALDSLKKIEDFMTSVLTTGTLPPYPVIQNIEIGNANKTYEHLLITIGESSHNNKHDSIGFAYKQKRLASPIYTSVIEDKGIFYPIITTLNNDRFNNTSKQNDYKSNIL